MAAAATVLARRRARREEPPAPNGAHQCNYCGTRCSGEMNSQGVCPGCGHSKIYHPSVAAAEAAGVSRVRSSGATRTRSTGESKLKGRGHVLLEGPLDKKGRFGTHTRWFILTTARLLYFRREPEWDERIANGWLELPKTDGVEGCTGWHVPSEKVHMARGETKLYSIADVQVDYQGTEYALPSRALTCHSAIMYIKYLNGSRWELRCPSVAVARWQQSIMKARESQMRLVR